MKNIRKEGFISVVAASTTSVRGMRQNKKKGFISVVALGIFALMAIFGIIVQVTVMDTIGQVRNANDYYAARDTADSVIEYMQDQVAALAAPQNINPGECIFNGSTGTQGGGTTLPAECAAIEPTIRDLMRLAGVEEVKITMETKGYAVADLDRLQYTQACYVRTLNRNANTCYIIPLPGTGTVGKDCANYDPDTVSATPDHAENPCNWNKLEFGSNLTDRVSIPLFNEGTENPFQSNMEFAIRLRTPCQTDTDGDLYCSPGDRYVLDTTTDEVVVQFQFSGEGTAESEAAGICDQGDNCSFVPVVEGGDVSTIYESDINSAKTSGSAPYITVYKDTSIQLASSNATSQLPFISNALPVLNNPILTLFLLEPLTNGQQNIPYLEYQITSNTPLPDTKTTMKVTVNVDGNIFEKTIQQNYQKGIIDFAVQN